MKQVEAELNPNGSKTMLLRAKFIRQKIDKKEVVLKYLCTDEMVSDVLTKVVTPQKSNNFVRYLVFTNPHYIYWIELLILFLNSYFLIVKCIRNYLFLKLFHSGYCEMNEKQYTLYFSYTLFNLNTCYFYVIPYIFKLSISHCKTSQFNK